MNKTINMGLDVGNFDTKTQFTSTCSGFNEFSKIPYGTTEALIINGTCYVPDLERFPYVRDKTDDNKCFILSLFGIAKDIIASLSGKCETEEELQRKINEIKTVNLGVGLPPAHMSLLRDKLIAYYKERFGDGITFSYYSGVGSFQPQEYRFNISLGVIGVYPQDLAAALIAANLCRKTNDPNFLTNKYRESGYYAIDIGGYTVDVVPIVNGIPRVSECVSYELGILRLYGQIDKDVNNEFGYPINDTNIQNVLEGKATALKPEVIEMINDEANEWVNKIINQIRRGGLEFNAMPVIFLGGGSALLKKAINSNKIVSNCEHIFLTNPRANAIGYKAFISNTVKAS